MFAHDRPRRLPVRPSRWARLLTLALLLGLAACTAGQARPSISLVESRPATATPGMARPAVPTVALVMKTLTNPFFAEMERGARRAEAELGLHLIVKTAAQETSIDQQIAIVESLIAERVDAIVVAPGDSTSLVPVLARAQAAGIAVVNIDNRLDPTLVQQLGLTKVPFVSVDNEAGAYEAARAISRHLARPTEAAILEGIRSAQNAIERTTGAQRAFAENPAVHVVAVESAHWKIDEAYAVTRKLFNAHPRLGVIFCANDMMALGALQYLAETGRDAVVVAGFDALDEARAAVVAGRLAVTVDQQAAEQGYLGVRYAAALLAGDDVPAQTMLPVKLITRSAQP